MKHEAIISDARARLPVQLEHRQIGIKRNPLTYELEPVIRTYFIGHGQQIARRDLAEKATHLAEVHTSHPVAPDSRQVLRRAARKAAKRQRAAA